MEMAPSCLLGSRRLADASRVATAPNHSGLCSGVGGGEDCTAWQGTVCQDCLSPVDSSQQPAETCGSSVPSPLCTPARTNKIKAAIFCRQPPGGNTQKETSTYRKLLWLSRVASSFANKKPFFTQFRILGSLLPPVSNPDSPKICSKNPCRGFCSISQKYPWSF